MLCLLTDWIRKNNGWETWKGKTREAGKSPPCWGPTLLPRQGGPEMLSVTQGKLKCGAFKEPTGHLKVRRECPQKRVAMGVKGSRLLQVLKGKALCKRASLVIFITIAAEWLKWKIGCRGFKAMVGRRWRRKATRMQLWTVMALEERVKPYHYFCSG